MKCQSLQGLTVQTPFLHLLSKEWDAVVASSYQLIMET